MPRTPNFLFSAAAIFAVVTLWLPQTATAGFEWTPAGKQTAPVVVPPVEAEPLEESVPPAAAPQLPEEAAPQLPEEAAPVVIPPAAPIAESAPAPETQMPEPAPQMKVVTPSTPGVSTPPSNMDMPPRPDGLREGDMSTAPVTVSVPPAETMEPMATPPAIEKVIAAPVEEAPPAKPQGLAINPYPLGGKPAQPAPASSPVRQASVPPASGNYAETVGFGSDVALALALRQVVPPEYSFSFAKGVNPGYRVSWNGGKPWNQVVNEMIAPLDLTSEIRGNTVVIKPSGAPESMSAPMGKQSSAVPMAAPQPEKIAAAAPAQAAPQPEAVKAAPAPEPSDLPPAQPRRDRAAGANQTDIGPAPAEENSIETASGDEAPQIPEPPQETLKKPETIQLSSGNSAADTAQTLGQPRIWEAKQGAKLKDVLNEWSTQANIDLVWKAAGDYTIDSGVLVNGTFPNAVKVLFMHGLDPAKKPRHSLVSNDSGAGSLVIEDKTS